MSSNALDPEIAAALAQLPTRPRGRIPVEQQRAGLAIAIAGMQKGLQPQLPNESEYNVQDHVVPVEDGEIKVRSVVPTGGGDFPLLVWYHGGGWAIGNIDMDDYYLRIISVKLKVVTVNVEYRLAPEFLFPTGINDAYAGLKWAADNVNILSASLARGFIVGGASAGGNFAASVALLARDDPFFKDRPLTGQLLVIPAVVHIDANVEKFRSDLLSMEENKDAPLLGADAVRHFNELLQAPPEDPRFSVLLAESHANLPPALIQVSALDPLRDEGILYEKLLKNSGVKTRIHIYSGLPHGGHMMVGTASISVRFNNDTHEGIKWLLSL